MKQLTKEQIQYLETNISIFGVNSRATEVQRQTIYDMHNFITGLTKRPNGCGRCWKNVKDTVYKQYAKQREE